MMGQLASVLLCTAGTSFKNEQAAKVRHFFFLLKLFHTYLVWPCVDPLLYAWIGLVGA